LTYFMKMKIEQLSAFCGLILSTYHVISIRFGSVSHLNKYIKRKDLKKKSRID